MGADDREVKELTAWKTVRVKQDLLTAVERTLGTGKHRSLSEFVSEAIQLHLDELRHASTEGCERPVEYPVMKERLLCSQDHVWAMVTPQGNIRVGLADAAQRLLKGAVGVHLEPVGSEVKRRELFGSIETWMFKLNLRAPVSGKIVRVNEVVLEKPSVINEDSYGGGWIAEIKPENVVTLEEELRELMGPKQYKMYALKHRSLIHGKE